MKVYVEELPNNCADCCFECDCFCCISNEYIINEYFKNEKHEKCPLQLLAEHDKQVVKQVCQEIKKQIKKEYVIFDAEEDRKTFNKILKQMQGENNVKD